MRTLTVQVHPKRRRALDLADVERSLRSLAARKRTTSSVEPGRGYVNFSFRCRSPSVFWASLRRGAFGRARFAHDLRASSIVVCEGTQGWSDYLLLHHFDASVPLDPADEL